MNARKRVVANVEIFAVRRDRCFPWRPWYGNVRHFSIRFRIDDIDAPSIAPAAAIQNVESLPIRRRKQLLAGDSLETQRKLNSERRRWHRFCHQIRRGCGERRGCMETWCTMLRFFVSASGRPNGSEYCHEEDYNCCCANQRGRLRAPASS